MLIIKFKKQIIFHIVMVIWHAERKRKITGSKYGKIRSKRKKELGRHPTHTKLAEKEKRKKIRTLGDNEKIRILRTNIANILDSNKNEYKKAEIKKVVENEANRHFARMNIITKGAIIDTELGKAKVTSRPGQTGIVNAVLI